MRGLSIPSQRLHSSLRTIEDARDPILDVLKVIVAGLIGSLTFTPSLERIRIREKLQ
jgi:hypothetical protein